MRRSFFVFICTQAFAAILQVPSQYGTIQSALNATNSGDTVLVEIGIYAEALIAPPHAFVLKGNVIADTGDYPRPVLDPSSLPNPTTLSCLFGVVGSKPTIEHFRFHNGPEMFPHESASGGIWHVVDTLTVTGCVFDSVYNCIASGGWPIRVSASNFSGTDEFCIYSVGQVWATDCDFSGANGCWNGIMSQSGTTIESCRFHSFYAQGYHQLWLSGDNMTLRNCIFGPSSFAATQAIFTGGFSGTIEQNLFDNCDSGLLIFLWPSCSEQTIIRHNIFRENHAQEPFQGRCIDIQSGTTIDPPCVVIDSNIFIDNYASDAAKCISASGHISLTHNRFIRNREPYVPALMFWNGSGILRDNFFLENEFAIQCDQGSADALYNWWGDSSGPRAVANPNGHGDSVGASVLYDPWYTDTSFFSSAPEPPKPLPEIATLEIYPNPFNLSATLMLTVPTAIIVRVEIFDILGRRIDEIFSGPVSVEKEIKFNASSLASGLYFARAYDSIGNRPVAIAKLLLLK